MKVLSPNFASKLTTREMKKIVTSLIILFSLATSQYVLADNQPIIVTQKGDDSSKKPQRAPLHLPLEVVYNDDVQTVEVIAAETLQANVYLYYNDELVDSSYEINCSFTLPYPQGSYTILIDSENWCVEGCFEI